MIQALAFYLFAIIAVASGIMVISSRNPVHSVLFLILTFFNAAGLFLLLGAEFLAMALIVVYVGAVAVLFLFVVMMLDINFVRAREGFLQYLPMGGLIGVILLTELAVVMSGWAFAPEVEALRGVPTPEGMDNTSALGSVLYTDYIYLFQASGVILLVAMVGTIMLTLRSRPGVRKQVISAQNARQPDVEIRKVTTGGGI